MAKDYLYFWRGLDAAGHSQHGEVMAINTMVVEQQLKKQGIAPFAIQRKFNFKFSLRGRRKLLTHEQSLDFLRELAALLNANINLLLALDIIGQSRHFPAVAKIINTIKKGIETGHTLSSVLTGIPNAFDALTCNLIAVGEKVGNLELMLQQAVLCKEKTLQQKRKIKKILFYPCSVLLITVIVIYILLVCVVPQLQNMFASFGAVLPLYTQLIISAAMFLRTKGWMILLGLVAALMLFFCVKQKSSKFSFYLDKLSLRLPYFGLVIQKNIIARYTLILGVALQAGLPWHEALTLVVNTLENSFYRFALISIREQVVHGCSFHEAMRCSKVFPERLLRLVTVGDESGSLDSMLLKISSYYDEEVNYFAAQLSTLLEPLIMIVLAIIVGGLVIGMYLPIFQLGKVI
jgi:type IV pilus assembly protein PilC